MKKLKTWIHDKLGFHFYHLEIGKNNIPNHKRACKICGKKQFSVYIGTLQDGYKAFYWKDCN